MAHIAGVKTTRDTKGNLTKVEINVKKYPQAIEALKELGLIEKSPLQKEVEENPENFLTPEELRQDLKQHIRQIWKK